MSNLSMTFTAHALRMGTLLQKSCTEQEVLLVRDHKDGFMHVSKRESYQNLTKFGGET